MNDSGDVRGAGASPVASSPLPDADSGEDSSKPTGELTSSPSRGAYILVGALTALLGAGGTLILLQGRVSTLAAPVVMTAGLWMMVRGGRVRGHRTHAEQGGHPYRTAPPAAAHEQALVDRIGRRLAAGALEATNLVSVTLSRLDHDDPALDGEFVGYGGDAEAREELLDAARDLGDGAQAGGRRWLTLTVVATRTADGTWRHSTEFSA